LPSDLIRNSHEGPVTYAGAGFFVGKRGANWQATGAYLSFLSLHYQHICMVWQLPARGMIIETGTFLLFLYPASGEVTI